MKKLTVLLAVFGLLLFAATSHAQFNSIAIAPQTIAVPSGVTGGSLSNATSTANVGPNGFSFIATITGTNAATTGNVSYAWRVSADGVSTNTGAAVYTNIFASPGNGTGRYYGVVPASAINGGAVHLTILNGNDATNRIATSSAVTVIAF